MTIVTHLRPAGEPGRDKVTGVVIRNAGVVLRGERRKLRARPHEREIAPEYVPQLRKLIDTQDALMGHPAYDLASMLQDARVDIDFDVADALYDHYCALRKDDPHFERAEFDVAYAILGAQRATKILGIFARLSKRDGKHGYLRHIPRVSRYLERNLAHPRLAQLKHWFDTHLPAARREAAR